METFKSYVELMKPRIVVLLIITAYCAMIVAQGGLPGAGVTLATVMGLGLSAGSAHAVNMWYDRDIDAVMSRTKQRPIPSGRMKASNALVFGIVGGLAAFAVMGWSVNWLAAVLSFSGYLFYVFVYTIWLKRRTPQNIVIGGAAGAFPPLVGWAAVTGHVSWAALWMFLIIFLWTPPHFWALALYKQDDYKKAGVPMMPVVRGARVTKWQSLFYTVLLVGASLALVATHAVGMVYGVVAVMSGLGYLIIHAPLLREQAPGVRWAKRSFGYSLFYLTVIFCTMVINAQGVPH